LRHFEGLGSAASELRRRFALVMISGGNAEGQELSFNRGLYGGPCNMSSSCCMRPFFDSMLGCLQPSRPDLAGEG
jgi:hypothetical protein